MLCQLSYAGTAAGLIVAPLRALDRTAPRSPRGPARSPPRPHAGCPGSTSVGAPSRRRRSRRRSSSCRPVSLVDSLARDAGVELGVQADELAVVARRLEQLARGTGGGSPTSKCSGRELGRAAAAAPGGRRTPPARRARAARRSRASSARRSWVSVRAPALRRQPGQRLLRQVEPVGERGAARPAAPGESSLRCEDLARADERLLTVAACGRARAARGRRGSSRRRASRSSKPSGASAGSCPCGSVTTRTSNPCDVASSIPRSVASSPAASASKQRKMRRVSRCSSLSCRSVSAVPIEATTGSKPAWRSAITSVFPSTTTARSCLRDRRPREVEPVEDRGLVEELALRRVDVLALQRIVVVQLARLEADDPAARVGEREHQARREVVAAARVRQPGGAQLVAREALLARLPREPAPGREPEPELAADLLAEPAAREVLAHGRARLPSPRGGARRTTSPGRAPRAAGRAASATPRAAARSPRTRASTRNRSASHSIAPAKSRFSVSRTNVITSPPLPQPKQ